MIMREPLPEESPTQKLHALRGDGSQPEIATNLIQQMLFAQRFREIESRHGQDSILRLAAQAFTTLLVDPQTRELAIHASDMPPHYYRATTLGDRQHPDMDRLREVFGPIAPYVSQIFFKLHPYTGAPESSRLEREARRIAHYELFNDRVAQARNLDETYNPVPKVLALESRDGISVIAEERIRGECLYERLLRMQTATQAHRFGQTNSRRRIDDFRKFVGSVIDRIVRAQTATLSLPDDLIDKVHRPRGNRTNGTKLDPGAYANAKFYLDQMHTKFIGTGETDDNGFPGALAVLLDPVLTKDRALVRNLRTAVGDAHHGAHFPLAYILGQMPPAIDCDRSLWNIMHDEQRGEYKMVDFETVTNSPQVLALANATAQGVYIFNQRTKIKQALTLEGRVVFPSGSSVAARDLLRWQYMSRWNEEIRTNAECGLYGNDFSLDQHLLTNFSTFKLGHSAAGVQRACVHFATFVKIMRNMIMDGDEHGYDLANKGMLISLTHVGDSINDYRASLKRDPMTLAHAQDLYARGNRGNYLDALGEFTARIRDVRQYLRQPPMRNVIRDRIARGCYRK